ncbi:MAG: hypothetical protein MJ009_05710 [Paludibacteraceae bacterium]|nr:hypothetical protein [Paludibacteraceae bacterium]
MKKLLFIGIVALMVQSLGAVTLPSTSYSPYAGGSSSGTEQSLLSGGTMVSGSYSVLSEGDDPYTHVCDGATDCEDCCYNSAFLACLQAGGDPNECGASNTKCVNSCEGGGSLPLDGGLSILLILSVAGGAVKAFRVKRDK